MSPVRRRWTVLYICMVSIQAASLKRRARERRNRLQRQNKKQLRDLGKAESNAAMQQAAQLLLRRLHGKHDPWLRQTLEKIAGDIARVHETHARLRRMSAQIHKMKGAGRAVDGAGMGGDAARRSDVLQPKRIPSLKQAMPPCVRAVHTHTQSRRHTEGGREMEAQGERRARGGCGGRK